MPVLMWPCMEVSETIVLVVTSAPGRQDRRAHRTRTAFSGFITVTLESLDFM